MRYGCGMSEPTPRATVAPTIDLDATDRSILRELENDARMPWAEIGRRVSLTPPAVRERVRRMERAGVITGYGAWIDPAAVGRPMAAMIRVATETKPRHEKLVTFVQGRDEVVECHTLTGDDTVLVRAQVAGMEELDQLTTSLSNFGRTTTSMILGSPIPWRNVVAR